MLYTVGVTDWIQEKFEGISALLLFFFILFFILFGEAGSQKCILSRHEEGQRNTILFLPFSFSYSLLRDDNILNYNKVFYNKSPCVCVCVCAQLLSRVPLFTISLTPALQAPPTMGFPSQEYCSGLPFPPARDLPDPGVESVAPALAGRQILCHQPV